MQDADFEIRIPIYITMNQLTTMIDHQKKRPQGAHGQGEG